jgi:hypothetical protein
VGYDGTKQNNIYYPQKIFNFSQEAVEGIA